MRVPLVDRVVKGDATVLVLRGRFQEKAMRRRRIPRGEVYSALRQNGYSSERGVEAVVLETDGSFSVIGKGDPEENTALYEVEGYREGPPAVH